MNLPFRKVLRGAVLLLVGLLAVSLRLVAQEHLRSVDPLQGEALLDTQAYDEDARAIQAGDLFDPPLSHRPPGYPWFLAAIRGCGGDATSVVRVQAWLDGVAVVLLGWLALRMTGKVSVALLASLWMALSPVLVYFSGERLETSLMVLAMVVHLHALVGVARWPERRAGWMAAGVTLGLASLIRPNVLLWAPCLLVGSFRRASGSRLALALLGLLVTVAPITLKNRWRGGEWVLVSANGGVNLWLGNVWDEELHGSVPYYRVLPGPVAGHGFEKLERRASAGLGLTDRTPPLGAASRWYAGEALTHIREHPGQALRRCAQKLLAFLSDFEMSNNRDLYRTGSPLRWPGARWLGWGTLLPLAVFGAVVSIRRRDAGATLAVGLALAWTASLVVFFVCARHRAPLVPVGILLASVAVVGLGEMIFARDRGGRRSAGWWLALALLAPPALLTHIDWFEHRTAYQDYEIDPVGVGVLWHRRGEFERAEAAYRRALERDAEDALALSNLASLRLDQQQFAAAEQLVQQSLALDPGRPQARNNLGLVLLHTARAGEALAVLRPLVAEQPEYGLAWVNLGRTLLALDRRGEAVAALQRALPLLDDPSIRARVLELLRSLSAVPEMR